MSKRSSLLSQAGPVGTFYGEVLPTNGNSKHTILSIQYLRAVAALEVVAAHASGLLLGQSGVDVFFVISGFIMWTITEATQDSGRFLLNRLVRIIPLYWIATVAMGLHQQAPTLNILRSMLFIPFRGEQDQIWPVLIQGWTLNYEFFFYLLFAAALPLPLPRGLRLCFLLATLVTLSAVGVAERFTAAVPATYTNPLLLEFGFGLIIAELRCRAKLPKLAGALILIVLGCTGFWLLTTNFLPALSRSLVWGVPSALIVMGALSFETQGAVPRLGWLLALGNASFAIYLFHSFIAKTVLQTLGSAPLLVRSTTVVLISAIVGLIIHYVVERPLIHMFRHYKKAA